MSTPEERRTGNLSKAYAAALLLWKRRPDYLLYKASPRLFARTLARLGYGADERYAQMQKTFYEGLASLSPKAVVGFFEAHEQFPYETLLLRKLNGEELKTKLALDFGCGMGRMIKRMAPLFCRVDGVDIAASNIEAAKRYTAGLREQPRFFVNNGRDLSGIADGSYQFVYSTIAMHHIPVHAIRMSLLREFHRVLSEGRIAIQMVYSRSSDEARGKQRGLGAAFANISFSEWEDDSYDAKSTNGAHDVVITEETLPKVRSDFETIGFDQVEFELADPPHETVYDKWIFIHARK